MAAIASTPELQATFERIWEVEAQIRSAKTGVLFGMTYRERESAKREEARAQQRLADLFDAISLEELREFGDWRRAAKAEQS